ncbi:MliC family protein [Bradyrhizobium jicamae]|uniref:MliC family protein n=1 Tax=Bradyrhizobium jicamae TaxID=280332 RepID=A0ABS5FHJ7_9BRAD|nr:MliC family protein [Bradyrhizobium jicamae]MBR0934677.1 MliC family protein [Bradyrhizobium jicamae]
MIRGGFIGVVTIVAGCCFCGPPSSARATTFQNYDCADDTRFTVAFYPHDSRAFVHFRDGRGTETLRKRLAFSGTRYSGNRVTLKISKSGRTTIKRPGRPETVCELMSTGGGD